MLDRVALVIVLVLSLNAACEPASAPVLVPSGDAPTATDPDAVFDQGWRDAIVATRASIRALLDDGAPGISVAVGVRGRIVWAEGFGWADTEARRRVAARTQFRVGSVSKPITSIAVGELIDSGQLDLDAPVQRYVPTFPQKTWPITTRELGGHLAGVRHYLSDEEMYRSKHYETAAGGLEVFGADPLLFEPGTRYHYSSYGWNLGLQTYGPGETIADCVIQEVDPAGNLVWSWRASDHIDPVLESLEPATDTIGGQTIVDVYHCNAIDVDSSGNLLLSSRHANALFYIDRSSGEIVWKLGGSEYSKDGADYIQVMGDPETTFSMQHDARFLPNGDISLFDDHGAGAGVARGVEYAVDFESEVATVAWQFLGIAASQAEGSCRRYADGETVIAWGSNTMDSRVVTEVNAEGQDVLDVSFAPSTPTYRAIKVPLSQLDVSLLRSTVAQ